MRTSRALEPERSKRGCGQTQERATGAQPAAQSCLEPFPTNVSGVPDILVLLNVTLLVKV